MFVSLKKKYFYLIIMVIFLISIFIRLERFDSQNNIGNLDASYHVLSTVKAMIDNPVSTHKLLPILTYGNIQDKGIPWGATVPDENGNYYYTSFPTLGFIVPYLYFEITSFPLTLKGLMIFNFIIHLVAALLLCRWLQIVLNTINISERVRSAIIVIGAATYLLSYEALFSHGIVYWSHSLFQVIWLLQLIFLTKFLYVDTDKKWNVVWLLIVCLLAPLTEWTGYLTSASIAIFLFTKPGYRKFSLVIVATTFLAGLLFIGQFLFVISPNYLFHSLKSRFLGRSSVNDEYNGIDSLGPELLHGYWESYGILLLIPFALALLLLIMKLAKHRMNFSLPPFVGGMLFILCVPILENILMLQHAVEYNFDRLKTLIPIVFMISVLIPVFNKRIRETIMIIWVVAIIINVWAFYKVERESIYFNNKESDIQKYIDDDQSLIKLLQQQTKPDAVYAIRGGVRGWVNLTLNRSVYERVLDLQQLNTILQQRDATQGVWLLGDDVGNQVYAWNSALIYDVDTDSKRYITLSGSFNTDEVPFPIIDDNWINGIGRVSASFIIVGSSEAQEKFLPGNVVTFINGEKRTIQKVEVEGSFIKINVEGDVLDWRLLGFPSKIFVENL